MSTITNISNKQNYWEIIDKKFSSLPSNDKFWGRVIQYLPIQRNSKIELKDQVVNFYKDLKNQFESKRAFTATMIAAQETRLNHANVAATYLNEFFFSQLSDIATGKSLQSAFEPTLDLAEKNLESIENCVNKCEKEISVLKQNFAQDPIIKLLAHCILAAHDKVENL